MIGCQCSWTEVNDLSKEHDMTHWQSCDYYLINHAIIILWLLAHYTVNGHYYLPLWDVAFQINIQSNLNSLNTDGSFTMANSNLFWVPNEILPIVQENKYLGKFSYFIMKLYVVCNHQDCLTEVILMSTLNIQLLLKKLKKEKFPKLLLQCICFLTWHHD